MAFVSSGFGCDCRTVLSSPFEAQIGLLFGRQATAATIVAAIERLKVCLVMSFPLVFQSLKDHSAVGWPASDG
jgi:hypothetical protein